MPQTKDLATETAAMRRLEAAYKTVEALSDKAKARVMSWAQEVFHNGDSDETAK
jgi:hypothetical protein